MELLVRAFCERFARADQPWIRVEPTGATWLEDHFLAASLGALSGGERRVHTVVVALADTTGTRRLDLVDVVTGIDRTRSTGFRTSLRWHRDGGIDGHCDGDPGA